MPFSADFGDIYEYGIKKACIDNGIIAQRVDEQVFKESILERIYRQIENADFIIAEMTNKNPNVFYEVGYSHAKDKICILITQDVSDIPFDLKHHPHLIYDGTAKDLNNKISQYLEWAKTEIENNKSHKILISAEPDNPSLKKDKHFHDGSFDLILTLENPTNHRGPEIEAIYIEIMDMWKVFLNDKECPQQLDANLRTKKILISPSIRRLGSGAFSKERLTFKRTFWTSWSGLEQKNQYTSKGNITVEVVTSNGNLEFIIPLEVTFEEAPF